MKNRKASLTQVSLSLTDLLNNLEKGRYSVPHFQRGFVWKKGAISELGDSIAQGFPISELLLMPRTGKLKIEDQAITNMHIADEDSEVHYVLDGQQRLTSIAQIFFPITGKRVAYYFDLLEILLNSFPDQNLEEKKSVQEMRELYPGFADNLICGTLKKGISSLPAKSQYLDRFVFAGEVIDRGFATVVMNFVSGNLNKYQEFESDVADNFINFLSSYLAEISAYSINVSTIGEDCDLDVVVRIFEKINSTGVRLNVFDLINAKTFSRGGALGHKDGGIKTVLTRDLNLWKADKGSEFDVIDKHFGLNVKKPEMGYDNLKRLTHMLFLSELYENNKSLTYHTPKYQLEKPASFWYERWEAKKSDFLRVLEWMNRYSITQITGASNIEYLASILLAFPNCLEEQAFLEGLKLYMMRLGFTGVSMNKSHLPGIIAIAKYARAVSEVGYHRAKVNHSFPKIDVDESLYSPESIRRLRVNNNNMKVDIALDLMYGSQNHKFLRLISGERVFPNSYGGLDRHHVFPKSRFPHSDQVHMLPNFVLIDDVLNREILKDRMPSEYVNHLKNMNPNTVELLEDNLLPVPEPIKDDFDGFMDNRAHLISSYIGNIIGTSTSDLTSESSELVEDETEAEVLSY